MWIEQVEETAKTYGVGQALVYSVEQKLIALSVKRRDGGCGFIYTLEEVIDRDQAEGLLKVIYGEPSA